MVLDKLSNAQRYFGLGERIAAGLRFLLENDLSDMEAGRHEIDGDRLFVMISDYDTKPPEEGFFEAHRKYIDVQHVIEGIERIGYANVADLRVTQAYDEENDFLKLEGDGDPLTFPAGAFVILFPDDAHMPGLALNDPHPVRKAVVKVAV